MTHTRETLDTVRSAPPGRTLEVAGALRPTEPAPPPQSALPALSGGGDEPADPPETDRPGTPPRRFSIQLPATRKSAHRARTATTDQLRAWGLPFDTAAHIVAELAANAVVHGRVPGRDFRLTLTASATTLRIEVADARGERLPVPVTARDDLSAESGRGLLLVTALADRWGVTPGPFPCKTVWAELPLPLPEGFPDDTCVAVDEADRKAPRRDLR